MGTLYGRTAGERRPRPETAPQLSAGERTPVLWPHGIRGVES